MAADPVHLQILKTDTASAARLGVLHTPHGPCATPAFMPVGTQGSVKGLLPSIVEETGTQLVLANTYHLLLRPGSEVVAEVGGLHRFMGWKGPILTDSGGFQVFSLADISKIGDQGVVFKSHVDGRMVELTPRRSIEVQNELGADIIMAFDQCPPATAAPDQQALAVQRTLRWAAECRQAHQKPDQQALFAIVQGGTDPDLRSHCAQELVAMEFPGYALGGLAVGEGFEAMRQVIQQTAPLLPTDRPRYLMGVGYPRDIVAAVAEGMDMFDCVLPTRNGRNAYAFTAAGPLRLRNSIYQRDPRPIEEGCDCAACRRFSRAALRHYFFAGEMLGPVLVSVHNVRFYQRLMVDIRQALSDGVWDRFMQCDPRCRMGPASGSPD